MIGLSGTPVLQTDRLILRGLVAGDFEAFVALHRAPHARWMWAPADRDTAWPMFLAMAGHWPLYGYGWWGIEDRVSGAFLGHVGFNTPEPGAEPELGWAVIAAAEGRGIAQEAARLARNWGAQQGIATPISHIDARNQRSIALAERLGARLEGRTIHAEDAVALHYRHPAGGAA